MKGKIAKGLFVVTVTLIGVLFSACDTVLGALDNLTSGVFGGEVPVYQGMSISSSKTVSTATAMSYSNGVMLLSEENGNKDNNGWHTGDVVHEEALDQQNPFPENNKNENIEREIKDSLEVVGSGEKIYYATLNADIYINIHIKNPDNFEILSFTLNGDKYSSYMFEDGSTMETIVIKYNVGSESGIHEYTIDAIKYVDGTQIKDVTIEGDKTVCAGVRRENQVTAVPSKVVIGTSSINFDVTISDEDELISYSNGALKAVLYDGETLVATKDLTVGENNVVFDGLNTSGLYQYAIVGYYDNLEGTGFGMNVLYKKAFYTEAIVLFDNIAIGEDSVDFNFVWSENVVNKTLISLNLYQGETLVQALAVDATSVKGLLSGRKYKLVAEYKNGENTELIFLEFGIREKETPSISIENVTTTETNIYFDINETDEDNAGEITKIELLHDDDAPIVAESLYVREFTGLLSNNEYTVRVTYIYDLNDGVGEQTIVKELFAKTLSKAKPSISIENVTRTPTDIYFDINETDEDNAGEITKVELLHDDDDPIVAGSLDRGAFTGLIPNNKYTIKVTYRYNLNDGLGDRELVVTHTVYTAHEYAWVTYKLYGSGENAYYAVSSCDMSTKSATIESHIAGIPVTVIDAFAFRQRKLTSVVIPDSVTWIAASAFEGCSNLTNVVIPDSVTAIGPYAFNSCTSLTSVVIPDSVITIDEYAFNYCINLTSVVIPDSVTIIGAWAFKDNWKLTSAVIHGSVTKISDAMFQGCTSLTSVVIPDSVTMIGSYAFDSCTSLTSVVIPDSVSTIGSYAFAHCESLTSVVIPDGVTTIDSHVFYYCESLTSVKIPDGVTTIGDGAFEDCAGLTNVVIPDSVTTIGGFAFAYCESLRSVVIGDGVTTIGENVFSSCTELTSVVIFGNVTSIERGVFSSCNSLSSVTIPGSVTTIADDAFVKCGNLKNVYYQGTAEEWAGISIGINNSKLTTATRYYYSVAQPTEEGNFWHYVNGVPTTVWEVPAATITVNGFVFVYSDELKGYIVTSYTGTETELVIPEECGGAFVLAIGANVFNGNAKIASVCFSKYLKTIGEKAFYHATSLTSVYYKGTAEQWAKIGIASDNDELLNATRYFYSAARPTESHYIFWHYVNGVPTVWNPLPGNHDAQGLIFELNEDKASYAVVDYQGIDHAIIIPSEYKGLPVTVIGKHAFDVVEKPRLADLIISVVIPDSVVEIRLNAFTNCKSLESITLSKNLKILGDWSLKGAYCLSSIELPEGLEYIGAYAFRDSGIGSINIPSTVTEIGEGAFYNVDWITEIVIPDSVTKLGNGIFRNTDRLKTVTLPAGMTELPEMTFGGATGLETCILPESVTKIGKGAFYKCSALKTLYIGANLTALDGYIFREVRNLSGLNIYYNGTETMWKNVFIDSTVHTNEKNGVVSVNNPEVLKSRMYFYSETQPTTEGQFWHYDENGNFVIWEVASTDTVDTPNTGDNADAETP